MLCPHSLGGKFGSLSSATEVVHDLVLVTSVLCDLPFSYGRMKRLGYITSLPTLFLRIHIVGK